MTLKMKATMETEAYIGAGCYFVIKQKDPYDEDTTVLLSYDQAMSIAEYIMANKDEIKEAWNSAIDAEDDFQPLESSSEAPQKP